jgi:hypothetical protein
MAPGSPAAMNEAAGSTQKDDWAQGYADHRQASDHPARAHVLAAARPQTSD